MKKSTKSWLLIAASIAMLALLGMINTGLQTSDPAMPTPNANQPTEPSTWHERYVQDNCERCPTCCVEIPAEDYEDFLDANP